MSISATYSALPSLWFEPSLHSAYFHISAKLIAAHPTAVIKQPGLLPFLDFLPLLEAYDAVGRPEAGIDLGLAIPVASHGLVGLSALSSDTLWDAMVTLVRYTPVRNALFDYRCFQQGDEAIVEVRPRLHLGEFEKFMGYTTVLAVYNIFKAVSEDAVSDKMRIVLPWERPRCPWTSAIASTAFDFDKEFLGIRVPLEMAMLPSLNADPDLCKRLKMAGEEELTRLLGSTGAKVRNLLHKKTTTAWPSLQEVADKLAMSKRTLMRKLEAEQLSYQFLLDQTRDELACWLLRSSNLQLREIAEKIGFSDQANLTRSFRRSQGCTPNEYRSRFRSVSDLPLTPEV